MNFNADDNTGIERIINRLVCLNCYSIYNLITQTPKEDLICDKCSSTLEKRLGNDKKLIKKNFFSY